MRSVHRLLPPLLLLAALAPLLVARRADPLPLYAARQGLPCRTCHFDPNGGGPRNDFGFAFAKNRHSLVPDTSAAWKDLDLTNRVGERMPLYFGLNQRFMLFANATTKRDSLDRLGFFNMENALTVSFQPHPRLTLVYSRDGFDDGATTQDAFGLIGGLPFDGYLKAGRFRTPFGLRMDDHTVATRSAFLDFQGGQTFLPYDPRHPDEGLEVGGTRGAFFGRAALTNGGSQVFGPEPFADAVTTKLGYAAGAGQVAASYYGDYLKGGNGAYKRATRWTTYGLTHWRRLALLGEVGAGTDAQVSGARRNLLAGWAEADYAFDRDINLRVRYDRFQGDRDGTTLTRPDGSRVSRRDLATWQRVSLEGEFVPVPFAELRWALRWIDPRATADALGHPLEAERQAFVQFHFSY